MKNTLAIALAGTFALAPTATGQAFGPVQDITTLPDGPRSVHASDLDGDGDLDVLFAAYYDNKIAWQENLGGGIFGVEQVITTSAVGANQVTTADLDGDGDPDVISASPSDDTVAWHENLGGGAFGPRQLITASALGTLSAFPADLDGDGDLDMLVTDLSSVSWFENQGAGQFGPKHGVTNQIGWASSVAAADFDGDGDLDVVSAAALDNEIAWYENLGGGLFGPQRVITTQASSAWYVITADLDNDGDEDVLSASVFDDKIAWYENLNSGPLGPQFGPQQVISAQAWGARSVFAADLDGDGDLEVLSASYHDDKIAWHENLGGGQFGARQVVTSAANGAHSVFAADLDGDGDADILAAALLDDRVSWFANIMGGIGNKYCFGDGSGTPCPCANVSAAGEGCLNSTGLGAILDGSGSPSVAGDGLSISASQLPASAIVLLFSGTTQVNGGNGVTFGDGLRCAGGTVTRHSVRVASPSGDATWGPGLASGNGWVSGDQRNFQGWYRDVPGSQCGYNFNLTQGLSIDFTP